MAAKAKKKQKKVTPPVEAETPVVKKSKKSVAKAAPAKAAKPTRKGKTTTEVAAILSKRMKTEISPVRLRRILRSDDFENDGGYTRYDLDDEMIERLQAALKAGAGQTGGKKGRKAKKEAPETEAPEELEELEEGDDDEEEEEEEESEESEESDDDDEDEDLEDLEEDDDDE